MQADDVAFPQQHIQRRVLEAERGFALHPLLAVSETTAGDRIARYVPALRVGEDAFLAVQTSWQAGLLVLGAWAGVAWVLGGYLLERRDV